MAKIICLATVAVIAAINARMWMLNWSPTDIVISSMKEGIGTNGINEPKKLTNARPR